MSRKIKMAVIWIAYIISFVSLMLGVALLGLWLVCHQYPVLGVLVIIGLFPASMTLGPRFAKRLPG